MTRDDPYSTPVWKLDLAELVVPREALERIRWPSQCCISGEAAETSLDVPVATSTGPTGSRASMLGPAWLTRLDTIQLPVTKEHAHRARYALTADRILATFALLLLAFTLVSVRTAPAIIASIVLIAITVGLFEFAYRRLPRASVDEGGGDLVLHNLHPEFAAAAEASSGGSASPSTEPETGRR